MKRLMLTLVASVIFALALASVLYAAPPIGKGGGGGKSFGPAPRGTVPPARIVTQQRVQITQTRQFHVQPQVGQIRVQPQTGQFRVQPQTGPFHGHNFGQANRINANINLGPSRVVTRINLNPAPRYVNYHTTHGIRFNQGTFYRGRDHFHWSFQRWDPRYGCYLYYDPCVSNWYYWNQPMGCYYPVNYCPTGAYASPYAAQPLPNVPVYPNGNGEPIAPPMGTMPNDYSPMDGMPPIPAPIYR